MTDTDMIYMASLQKRNEDLEARVAELEEKHFSECAQIAHYDDELRRAKELLKEALIIAKNCHFCDERYCDICKNFGCEWGGDYFEWEHVDEALALIGEDINVPANATDANIGGKEDGDING